MIVTPDQKLAKILGRESFLMRFDRNHPEYADRFIPMINQHAPLPFPWRVIVSLEGG